MKVIICGAGIAGLTLGLQLAQGGCQVVILEAAPALRDQGYMIDFFGPGYDTAQQLGLLAPLRQLSYQIPEIVWLDVDCRQLAALHYQNVSQALGGRLLTLMRGDLAQVLFSALPAVPFAALQQNYGHLGWLIPTALQQARQRSHLYYDCVSQVRLTRWSRGRVALVGDACHAVSLVAGQGASLAMSSAQVLSEELLSMSSPELALARYESRQKPLIERKQRSGRRLVSWFVPQVWWQSAARNVALRVADRAALSWILRPLIA